MNTTPTDPIVLRITEEWRDFDGEVQRETRETTLDEWLSDNVDDEDVQEAGAELRNGDEGSAFSFGGGAMPSVIVERVTPAADAAVSR